MPPPSTSVKEVFKTTKVATSKFTTETPAKATQREHLFGTSCPLPQDPEESEEEEMETE